MMPHLAIVGAGPSGSAAAWALRTTSCAITLFEKSRGFSGRAATRRHEGIAYDHGANYFKTPSVHLEQLIQKKLPAEDLVPVCKNVWTFDADGVLQEGDPAHNSVARWTYRRGISMLGRLLGRASSASIQLQTRVERLEQTVRGWDLFGHGGGLLGSFDAVLLTPPAPQTAELIEVSTMAPDLQQRLVQSLRQASYRTQLSVVLGYRRTVPRTGDFYALLNTDGAHAIAWLSFEEDKPGHVPAGEGVLIVQMAPAWSRSRYEDPLDLLVPDVVSRVGALLAIDLDIPAWADLQRWRYALPDRAADADALRQGERVGLFFAGDGIVGEGRVAAALESGLNVAERMRVYAATMS